MCAFTELQRNNGEKAVGGSSIENWQDIAMGNSPSWILDVLWCSRTFKQGHRNKVRLVEGTAATKAAGCGVY